MNNIVYKTVRFNENGGTPQGFSPDNMEAAYGIFIEEVEEVRQGISNLIDIADSWEASATQTSNVATEIADGCADTCVTAISLLYRMGLTADQINEAFEAVSDSNLSKFPQSESEAQLSVENYAQDQRYENVRYKAQGNAYVVYGSKSDGTANYKILKGVGFQDPEQKLRKLVGDIYVEEDE